LVTLGARAILTVFFSSPQAIFPMSFSALRPSLRNVRASCAQVAQHNSANRRGIYSGGSPGGRFMMPGFWNSPPQVIPHFREETDFVPVEKFTIDCSEYKLDSTPDPELRERMEEMYKDVGVVRLTNTRLRDVEHMKNYASVIVKEPMPYEGGANPREGIANNVFEVGAPNDAWLHYHHEMAYNNHSMENLAFCSVKTPLGKGDTYLSENTSVTEDILATEFGRKLKDLGVRYVRCMTDKEAYDGQGWAQGKAVYNHWQLSMGANDPEQAKANAEECGLSVEWVTDPLMPDSHRYMKTSFVTSAFEYCPHVDRNVLFSSIADHNMWFDSWQGVDQVPPAKRPLQMTFGDGSPITLDELRLWTKLYAKGGTRVQWEVGDILAFCNYRFAHGRPAFDLRPYEERQVGVMLGKKFQRVGQLPDAW